MNTLRTWAVVGMGLSLAFAASCGSDNKNDKTDGSARRDVGSNRDTPLGQDTSSSQGCEVNGTTYQPGQSFTLNCVKYTCQGDGNVTSNGTSFCTDAVVQPPDSSRVDYEGEVAVVIRKRTRRLRDGDPVDDAILGYTCFNDVTARDLQAKDVQFTRAKSFDTFAACGPCIATDVDPSAAVAAQPAAAPAPAPAPAPGSDFRTWKDASGQFSLEAKYAGLDAGRVRLLGKDGRERKVPLEKLSPEDQKVVKELQQASTAKDPFAVP